MEGILVMHASFPKVVVHNLIREEEEKDFFLSFPDTAYQGGWKHKRDERNKPLAW